MYVHMCMNATVAYCKSLPQMGHCSQESLDMAQPLCWSPKSFLESIIFFSNLCKTPSGTAGCTSLLHYEKTNKQK